MKFAVFAALVFCGALFFLESVTAAPEYQADWQAQLTTSLGTNLGAEPDFASKQTSFTFEPWLAHWLNETQSFELHAVIDRSTEPRLNFTVPKAIFAFHSGVESLSNDEWGAEWRVFLNAVDLDRWGIDGYAIRAGGAGQLSRDLSPGLSVYLRAGPFAQLTRNPNAADSQYGFSERLGLEYQLGKLNLRAILMVDHALAHEGNWKHEIGTTEQISITLHEQMRMGVTHELISTLIDDSTQFYRPIRATDRAFNRFSVFTDIIF